jgi:hypothetical protein
MKKYYFALTSLMVIVVWFSCVSIAKTQSRLSQFDLGVTLGNVPVFAEQPSVSFPEPAQNSMVKPTNRTLKSYKLATKSTPNIHGNDLLECRNLMDTVSYLNEASFQMLNEPAPQKQH